MTIPRMPLIALSPDDAAAGVGSFAAAVESSPELQNRLPHARAWYAVRATNGVWKLAPSKWCGYVKMTPEKYVAGASNGMMDGRLTEKRLGQWFTPLVEGTDLHRELMAELRQFLSMFGKQPNAAARISVIPQQTSTEDTDDSLVRLLLRVANSLPAEQRAHLIRELRQ